MILDVLSKTGINWNDFGVLTQNRALIGMIMNVLTEQGSIGMILGY